MNLKNIYEEKKFHQDEDGSLLPRTKFYVAHMKTKFLSGSFSYVMIWMETLIDTFTPCVVVEVM